MAKRQSRRSVSLKGTTYERLRQYCGSLTRGREISEGGVFDGSISGFIERIVARELDTLGVPRVDKAPDRTPKRPDPDGTIGGGIFTF